MLFKKYQSVKKAGLKKSAFFMLFLLLLCTTATGKKHSFSVNKTFQSSVMSLIDMSVDLHKAVYDKNKEHINLLISKITKHISYMQAKVPKLLPHHEQSYIDKLLRSVQFNIEALAKTHRYKNNYIYAINRKLIHIARIYDVKRYKVFFCATDRSIWMQDNTHNKPLHLNHAPCGTPVK